MPKILLHNHPQLEAKLGLDEKHVIIDREAYLKAQKLFSQSLPVFPAEGPVFIEGLKHHYIISMDPAQEGKDYSAMGYRDNDGHYHDLLAEDKQARLFERWVNSLIRLF